MGKIEEMLIIGKECGLTELTEAYNNYMTNYSLYFNLENLNEEYWVFRKELEKLKLIDEKGYVRSDLTIDDVLKKIED